MATKKQKAKSFPKEQGEEGAPDRFVPPDRMDQLPADPEDHAQTVQVRDLGEDIEIIEGNEESEETSAKGKQDNEDDDDAGADETESGQRARGRQRARDDDADDDQDDDSRYSRRVRARINRERALRQQSDANYEAAVRKAKEVEDRLTKLERVQTEVAASADVKALEAQIAQLEKDAAAALEADDTKRAFELQAQIGDLKSDLKLLKRDLETTRKQQLADEERRKQEQNAGTADSGKQHEIAPNTIDWKEANRGWFQRARYKDAREDAIAIDLEIQRDIKDGKLDFENYSDEHFEMLNERLAELYPDLPLFNLDGTEFEADGADDDQHQERDMNRDRGGDRRDRDRRSASSNGRRPPVGSGNGTRRNGRQQQSDADLARQGKVSLSERDFQQMRLYGLDPKNAEHKKRFAKERMRSILTEESRGGR